jgi:hypothetical protein
MSDSQEHQERSPQNSLQSRLEQLKKAQEARRRRPAQAGAQETRGPVPVASAQAAPSRSSPERTRADPTREADLKSPQHREPETGGSQSPGSASGERLAQLIRLTEERRRADEQARGVDPLAADPDNADAAAEVQPWADDRTPPGSAYSWEEWCAAMDDGQGGTHIVFELRNTRESVLIRMPRDPARDAFETMLFDGCLILAPKARTSHPDAVCGELALRNAEFPWTYRVVRPNSHRADREYLFGAKGWVDFGLPEDGPPCPQPRRDAADRPRW